MTKVIITEGEVFCPYCNIEEDVCMASLSGLSFTQLGQSRYCSDDDYDECPFFLSKKLRKA